MGARLRVAGRPAEARREVRGKAGEKLRAAAGTVALNRRLTELVRDLDLPVEPASLRRRPYDLAAFTSLLDELEFRNASLRQRLFAADPGGGRPPPDAEPDHVQGRELGPDELAPWLASHATGLTGLVADCTWVRGAGDIARIALAAGDGNAASFEPSVLTAEDERAFAAWLADPARPKALHDVKSLLRVLGERGRASTGSPPTPRWPPTSCCRAWPPTGSPTSRAAISGAARPPRARPG
ncbi:hypothetical protein [Actinomadura luteofluorescens]